MLTYIALTAGTVCATAVVTHIELHEQENILVFFTPPLNVVKIGVRLTLAAKVMLTIHIQLLDCVYLTSFHNVSCKQSY